METAERQPCQNNMIKSKIRRYRRSFHFRFFLALVVVIAVFIPGTGYIGYLQALHVAENQMEQYATSTASQLAQRVASFLSQHTYNVKLLASFFEKGLIDPSNEEELLTYFQLFKNGHPEFVNIYLGDARGNFFMVPPQRPEIHKIFDPRERQWYRGAATSGSIRWTDVYLFASQHKPGITVSAPVYNSENQLTGVCGIDIDLIAFSRFLQGMDIGKQAIAYIFENNSGHIIAHPGLAERNENTERLDLLQACHNELAHKTSRFGLVEYRGEQFFTAYAPYPGRDWTVGVTISTADYLQKIQIIKNTTLSLIFAAILLSLILSYLLTKNILNPLLHLQQGIERIAGGDLDHRLPVKGPDIARDLAHSFNRMTISLKKSLEELKATYAELQEKQKLAAVGKMTAGIAHEIKNPLGIILGSTQVFMDKNRPWEMREKAASFIMDEVMRLDNTLKAFLAFAKPTPPVFSEVNIIDLLEETLSATEERFREDGYFIVRDLPETVPPFEADPTQIRQVFMNIFLNSIKAMADGGTITVRIRVDKEPENLKADKRFISIRNPFTLARDWLIVSISDEGCGIPREYLDKIMDPFVSFSDDGIGLGLSIVSQIVRLHRGHINIDSAPGQGTTFHIFFPCLIKEIPADDKFTDN